MNWWLVEYVAIFVFGGVVGGAAVALDASKYLMELSRARRAIEFAHYMATCAESYMDEVNNEIDGGVCQDSLTDAFRGLRSSIYEFRKREKKVTNG